MASRETSSWTNTNKFRKLYNWSRHFPLYKMKEFYDHLSIFKYTQYTDIYENH